MTEENLGECECCAAPQGCCAPGCDENIELVISGTGSALDGSYSLTKASLFGNWSVVIGSCTWEIVFGTTATTFKRNAGTPAHTFVGNAYNSGSDPSCGVVGNYATMTLGYAYNAAGASNNCGLGTSSLGGGTAAFTWNCSYPEYIQVDTDIADGDCDCSGLNGLQIPIDCTGFVSTSDIEFELVYSGSGCLNGQVFHVDWLCGGFGDTGNVSISLAFNHEDADEMEYINNTIDIADLRAGSSVALSRSGSSKADCDYPSTISISAHNFGFWC